MKLIFHRRSSGGLLLLTAVCCLFMSCAGEKSIEQMPAGETSEETVIIVKVPPFYDDKLSKEENFWRYQHFLHPQMKVPNPVPKGLPNDGYPLSVTVEENGKIKLNSLDFGSVSETQPLTQKLTELFQERERNGVYEEETWKVDKAVGIGAVLSIKYGDFIKVVGAVKQSGAEPIILLFDDDARPKLIINLSTNTEDKK